MARPLGDLERLIMYQETEPVQAVRPTGKFRVGDVLWVNVKNEECDVDVRTPVKIKTEREALLAQAGYVAKLEQARKQAGSALAWLPEPVDLNGGDLTIDPRQRIVHVAAKPVALTARQFELLAMLASDPTRCWTKKELLATIWGYHDPDSTRTLQTHAYRLRTALAGGKQQYVRSVHGVGYSLIMATT